MPYIADIPLLSCLLAGLSLLLTIVYLWWRWSMSRAIRRRAGGRGGVDAGGLPGVSVIVYTCDQASMLQANLPAILEQDYPCFEVIVVNDGQVAADSAVVAELGLTHGNLYETFVPLESRNLSRKKLALMMGVKAARHEVVVTTSASCRPDSPRWLETMARNFTPGVEMVIGQCRYDAAADTARFRRFRLFSWISVKTLYLGYAAKGRPFRGSAGNLAYRKSRFFEIKGFSSSMNLHHGDDDIFVSQMARKGNARVELSPQGAVTARLLDIRRALREDKMLHDFTSGYLATSAYAVDRAMRAAYVADVAAAVAFAAVTPGWTACWAVALALLLMVPQSLIFRRDCATLGEPGTALLVPLFTLARPVADLALRLKGRRYRETNFTWRRKRSAT